MEASGHATWYADVSMMSARGSGLLTSSWATLTRSTSQQVSGQRRMCQSLGLIDRWDPCVRFQEKKEKKKKRVTCNLV